MKNFQLSWKHFAAVFAALAFISGGLWNYADGLGASDLLSVSFLNVGQGDAIYIRAPNGNDILIDGGPDNAVIQQLAKTMPMTDHDIGMVVATHPDKDHIAGLPTVFEHYDVKKFLYSEVRSDSQLDEDLDESAASEEGLENIIARRGQRFILDDARGVYMDILFPDQDTSEFKETNDASIVARLVYGTQSFLLTGDSGIPAEQFLARADGAKLKTTVLKLGHHGSNSSSSDEYLDQVKPQFAIVSAGKNNSYHHPSASVVKRVEARGIKILSTIDLGTITMQTDGKEVWIK